MKAIASEIESVVGSQLGIWDWDNISPLQQKQILRAIAPGTTPSCLVCPDTPAVLAEIMSLSHRNHWKVLPCGSGTKLSWGGSLANVDLVVSTAQMNRLIDHAVADLTITVEAGMPLAQIQLILAQTGQFLALDPTIPHQATAGGIVATADAGSLRQRYGSVRDQLLGISFVRADGQIAKAGGRVVKNVAGYDLMKLFTGSFGTLGIISQVTFRVYPLPETSQTVILAGNGDAIAALTAQLLTSALTPTAIDLLSPRQATCLGLAQNLTLLVRFQSVAASVTAQSERLLALGKQLGLSVAIADDEAVLWERLGETQRQRRSPTQIEPAIICKIGVLPAAAVATLTQLELLSSGGMGLIHAGKGLGMVRFPVTEAMSQILSLRRYCESQGGFLTILEAPTELKEKMDVWGYIGNSLDVMRRLKQQFDPKNILSPNRFVV
jgi:glycolate oxidase FAD binding subunit